MFGKPSHRIPRHTVATTAAMLALSVLALLLWGRLKLVAGVPRTAYAEPKPVVTPRVNQVRKPIKATPVPANRPDLQGD